MINKTKIVYTSTSDPWWNLSVEEYLFNNVNENECILYLWRNNDTVVIGKHQNPWRECKVNMLESQEGRLARRLSGGGAVFHDIHNLNFTFILKKDDYDLERQVNVILNAVKKVGIDAKMTGRNDITVDGKKFSGNAFCFRRGNAFHHGTILIATDFGKLSKYLQVSKEKIKSKGVKSVQSRVTNLIEYNPDLNIDKMAEAFMEAFQEEYGKAEDILYNVDFINQEELNKLYEKYKSWDWRFGESPKFDLDIETRFEWGEIQIGLKLHDAVIKEAKVYSDALDEEFIGLLPQAFEGKKLNSKILSDSLYGLKLNKDRKKMIDDISKWIISKEF